jgi:hypothetical protein
MLSRYPGAGCRSVLLLTEEEPTMRYTLLALAFLLSVAAFAADGTTGFSSSVPAWKWSLQIKFDGKDYPVIGPTVPAGMAASAKLIGPTVIELVNKTGVKVFATERLEVSGDGKTLTDAQAFVGSKDKPTVWVFDRK